MSIAKRGQPQIVFRLDQELKDAVHEAARRNKRSVNSELLVTIEQAYLPKRWAGGSDTQAASPTPVSRSEK